MWFCSILTKNKVKIKMLNKTIHFINRHRLLVIIAVFVLLLPVISIINYYQTKYYLDNRVPELQQKNSEAFPSKEVIKSDLHSGCENESKYGIDIVCDRTYRYSYKPTGNTAKDEQALRDFYDVLMADGWTGGSQPDLFATTPAKTGKELKTDRSGILRISAWKSPGGGIQCDINASFVPFIPRLENEGGEYDYSLYCRKTVLSFD